MAALTPVPKIQFFAANGEPLVGGKLYSYAAGTTTPLVTYTDQAATSANTNPVILDSRGEASVWLGTGPYKLRLTTATDVDIWTVDDIYSEGALSMQELLSASGSSLVGFIADGTGATYRTVQSKLRDTVSVLDFGADPTGATDSSAAFVAAVATGRAVYVPKGTYKASFDLPTSQVIFGDSAKGESIIKPSTGATYCIRIDATSSGKQHCQIRDLAIQNLDSVANCVGILFKGTDVNTINDWHTVSNVYITDFARGIEVLGRQIWSSYYNVEITGGTRCFNVSTDTSTPAFNQNTFIQCRFADCTQEGIRIVGQNTTLGFYTCDFEICNSSDAAGVAAVYLEDSEQASFIGCYWENNGDGVAVDTGNPANNSVGVKFAGTYCYNPKIEQAYFVTSGLLVWVAASVRGGILANSRLNPLGGSTGWTLYVSSTLSSINAPQFCYDSSNFTNGKISFPQDVNGNYTGRVSQVTSCYWMTSSETLDLTQTSKVIVNPNGTTFTGITTINNRIPGMELWVWNESGSNSFTIDSSLIHRGSGVIAALTGKRYIVGGYPANGKLIEM